MREFLNIDVLANWVVMLRADVDGAIWLSDDEEEARFYEGCAHEAARVVPTPQVALPLLDKVEERGVKGVVGTFRGRRPPRNATNVFWPAIGDVASLLIFGESCERVLRDVCGSAWLLACEKDIGPIRNRVAWIARVHDELRQAYREHGLEPPARCVSDMIDWDVFNIDWARIVPVLNADGLSQAVIQRARALGPSSELRCDLAACDGMDAVQVLAAATRSYRPRGIAASTQIDASALVSLLRMAVDASCLEADEVFWRMRLWERTNRPYPLLREWRKLDPLSVVWDQRYWEDDLSALLRTLQSGENLAVFQMDLDNFKAVNSVLGHAGGDQAIRLYAQTVKNVLGHTGEIYRRGGDEVLVLAPSVCEAAARSMAEDVRAAIEQRFTQWTAEKGLDLALTASIGLVVATGERSASQIVSVVDEAQQQAKKQGKNRVVCLTCSD